MIDAAVMNAVAQAPEAVQDQQALGALRDQPDLLDPEGLRDRPDLLDLEGLRD